MTATAWNDWFAQTLQLPEQALLSAVAVKLARGREGVDADADTDNDAVAAWMAWRVYVQETPGALADVRAHRFARILRRVVETLACGAYTDVVWVAAWRGASDTVPDLAWDLLVSDTLLTESAIRPHAMQPGMPLVITRVQANGERLPLAARGPFVVGISQ